MITGNTTQKIQRCLKLTYQKSKQCLLATLLLSLSSFAEAETDDYQYESFEDFQSTINEKMGQDPKLTSRPNSNYLSSSMFNISGPLEISSTWSDIYGPTITSKYVKLLNPKNAFAIEAAIGTMENRINVTFGRVLSPRNRVKITAERLAQKQTFNFYSGAIDEWVSQYAGGGEYQYLIGKGLLNNVSVGGYYAHSLDKSLEPVLYLDGENYFINYRHIAGATSMGGNISLGLQPWKTGVITFTSYYDSVHYNSIYSDVSADNSNTFGYGVALEQYLSSAFKTSLSYSSRALYETIQAGIQLFHNIRHDTAAIGLSLGVSRTNYTTLIENDNSNENAITLGLQYYFSPIRNAYTMPTFNFGSLAAWTSTPAVRMETVLAAADQENIAAKLTWTQGLLFKPININTEEISWNANATSNVPNASITYNLLVDSEEDVDFPTYDEDVSNTNTKTIYGLKPKTKYIATLTVTENVTLEVNSTTEIFETVGGEIIPWDPNIRASNATISSVLLTFTAPKRTVSDDAINYQLTLTNATNQGDVHTYTLNDDTTAEGNNVSMTADNLLINTVYNISISATNAHEDYYDITQTEYSCQTAKEAGNLSVPTIESTTPLSIQFQWISPERYGNDEVVYSLTLTNQNDNSETQHFYKNITRTNDTTAGVIITFDTASDGKDTLTPNTTYDVQLSATSNRTTYSDTNTTAITPFDTQTLTKITAKSSTSTSIVFQWNAPKRYGTDQVTYTLTLLSQDDPSSDQYIYNIVSTDDKDTLITFDTASDSQDPLVPNTTYDVQLSAKSTHTEYIEDGAKTTASTPYGAPINLNAPTLESSTAVSIKFKWISPERHGTDAVIYKLTLTNQDNSADEHVYTDISRAEDTAAGVPIIFDTVSAGTDALAPNAIYDVQLSAESAHTAYQDTTAIGNTIKGSINWDSLPINISRIKVTESYYEYNISWEAATLNPTDDANTVKYAYTIQVLAYENFIIPGTVISEQKGTIDDRSALPKKIVVYHDYSIYAKTIKVMVTASDENQNYQNQSRNKETTVYVNFGP